MAPSIGEHIRRYDDETVVFNFHSWQTHLLNQTASLVFDALCRQPHSVESLRKELSEAYGSAVVQVLDDANLQLLLEQLKALHLVAAVE